MVVIDALSLLSKIQMHKAKELLRLFFMDKEIVSLELSPLIVEAKHLAKVSSNLLASSNDFKIQKLFQLVL